MGRAERHRGVRSAYDTRRHPEERMNERMLRLGCLRERDDAGLSRHRMGRCCIDDRLLFESPPAQAGFVVAYRAREARELPGVHDDIAHCAKLTDARLGELLTDPGLIRNRLKITSVTRQR